MAIQTSFTVDDIREVFQTDLRGFVSDTREHLGKFVSPQGAKDHLELPSRNAHSMKGVAAMVGAWGLSHLGEDLESLYEVARSFWHSEPERARGIAGLVMAMLPQWEEMSRLTLSNQLEDAYELYRQIRRITGNHYGGYLPERAGAPGEKETILNGEATAAGTTWPAPLGVVGVARQVAPPTLQVDPAEIGLEESEEEPAASAPEPGAAGVARAVVRPKLLVAKEEERAASTPEPVMEGVAKEIVQPGRRAAGLARAVAKPKLLAAEEAPEKQAVPTETPSTEAPSETVQPVSEAAGLARQVATPKFLTEEEPLAPSAATNAEIPAAPEAPVESVQPASQSAGLARSVAKPKFLTVEEEEAPAAPVPAASPVVEEPAAAPVDELAEVFRAEIAQYFGDLGRALGRLRVEDHAETWSEVRRLCHTIKGSAAMVGQMVVSEKARACETLAGESEEGRATGGTKNLASVIHSLEEAAKALGLPFKLVAPSAVAAAAAKNVEASAAIDPELAQAFVLDAGEQMEALESALLAWEKGTPGDHQAAAFRVYHTLKGAANSIGLTKVGHQIHAVEGLLEAVGNGAVAPRKEMFTFLLGTVDHLRKFSTELAGNSAADWTLDWLPTVTSLASSATLPSPAATAATTGTPQSEEDSTAELARAFALDMRDQSLLLEQAILAWERQQNSAEQIQAAYRVFHTLKGGANSLGFTELGGNFHVVESLLDRLGKAGQLQPPTDVITFLLGTVDDLQRYAADVERDPQAAWQQDWKPEVERLTALLGENLGEASAAVPIADDADLAPAQVDYIRVEASRVRKLLNQVGEQVVERNRFSAKLDRAKQLRQLLAGNRQRLVRLVETFQDQFEYSSHRTRGTGGGTGLGASRLSPGGPASEDEFTELEFDRYDEYNMLSRQLTEVADDLGQVTIELERLVESFRTDEKRFATTSKVMQEDITTLTSQPIESLFRRLDRIFRDAVQTDKKEAALVFQGARSTLDRSIIERLYTPLLHLVRNAVAHGIETPEQREASAKPAQGTVTVSAEQSSNQILITIQDDGAGVDASRVLARARDRGLVDDSVTELSAERVLELLFTPGFSTASEVTTIAGRGVGLDVVKKEIEAMNGSVTMETQAGKGTTWRLQLPLTLAVSEAVIVGLGTQEFAIPLNFVTTGMLLAQNQILVRDGLEYYLVAGDEMPLLRLGRLFGETRENPQPRGVLLSIGDTRCVVMVDAVPARREIVVKGFDPLLARHPFLDGATLDSEGRPVLILSAPALLKLAAKGVRLDAPKPVAPTRSSFRVAQPTSGRLVALVVDDSLSVRTVQERLLGDMGVDVVLANDGLDALEKLRQRQPDLIFTDLEMPRMNGYDLISTVRSNEQWAAIPMVLVTSRAAQKHLDKARELGCSGFLIKPFNRDDLAAQLMEHTGFVAKQRVASGS